jgi:hypothetical protein
MLVAVNVTLAFEYDGANNKINANPVCLAFSSALLQACITYSLILLSCFVHLSLDSAHRTFTLCFLSLSLSPSFVLSRNQTGDGEKMMTKR